MKKKDLKIIQQINAEAWGKYGDKLFIEREKAGAVKQVLDLALTKEQHRFSPAEIEKLKNIKESGMLDGTEKVEDVEVAEKYEKYVAQRIDEEIKKGNLSKPEKALKKAKQYGERDKKSK